jgi:amino-acid N-acetyltransferase
MVYSIARPTDRDRGEASVFSERSIMTQEQQVGVREARFADAAEIFTIIRRHPDALVPRSKSDILQNIDRFYVGVVDGQVRGVISWGILPELGAARHPSVEIKSLAVDAEARGRGLGRELMDTALQRVRVFQPEQVIVLTFVPEFFRAFGFREVAKEKLMHKLYTGCLNCTRYDSPFTCPEIAMSLTLEEFSGDAAPAG